MDLTSPAETPVRDRFLGPYRQGAYFTKLKSMVRRWWKSWIASFTAATLEAEFVPSLWQQLPAEVLEKVLTKLPLSALRKFSRVSKRWKALFRSVEFARECESVEWTFFYLCRDGNMYLPNLETNSWDKHSLDCLKADECIADDVVAVDSGLLCYRVCHWKKGGFDPTITLVIHNPLTRKWRRLIVPYELERRGLNRLKMMYGLIVDRESGSYKVVVGFWDQYLPRKAFLYDSVSNSWSISAALTPVLIPYFDEDQWRVRSVVCSNGELLWLIEDMEDISGDEFVCNWLIKYNFELDAWSTAREELPHLYMGDVHLVHHDVEKRPVMVNLMETRRHWNLPSSA